MASKLATLFPTYVLYIQKKNKVFEYMIWSEKLDVDRMPLLHLSSIDIILNDIARNLNKSYVYLSNKLQSEMRISGVSSVVHRFQ